jgi:hypothetical protein
MPDGNAAPRNSLGAPIVTVRAAAAVDIVDETLGAALTAAFAEALGAVAETDDRAEGARGAETTGSVTIDALGAGFGAASERLVPNVINAPLATTVIKTARGERGCFTTGWTDMGSR